MYRLRAFTAIGTIILLPLLAIHSLHGLADRPWFRIDHTDPAGWLASVGLVDALVALSRPAALAAAYWCAGGTLLYLLAVLSGSERARLALAPMTLPLVRRLADRVVAGSLAMGVLAVPLFGADSAADQPPPRVEVAEGYVPVSRLMTVPPPLVESPDQATPATETDMPSMRSDTGGRPMVTDIERTDPDRPEHAEHHPEHDGIDHGGLVEVVVARGDHLWALAEQRLTGMLGRSVGDHEVAPYWRAVVDENLPRLRSGDADILQPGEVIVLPDPGRFIPTGS